MLVPLKTTFLFSLIEDGGNMNISQYNYNTNLNMARDTLY